MTFYQNTTDYCNVSVVDNTEDGIISYTDENVYMETIPYETIEYAYPSESKGEQEKLVSELSLARAEPTTNLKDFYEVSGFHYSSDQYTPLTPEPVSYPVYPVLQPNQSQTQQNHNNFIPKKHCAQITILPTSRGNFKAVFKKKRKRTVFTTEQIEALEEIFRTKQYITREDRQDIVKKLKLNDKAVKIWFQNRRLKIKRMADEAEQEDCFSVNNSEERGSLSPDMSRLDFVESQIIKNTDKYGFVTLDDAVMGDLVYVIDDVLSKCSLDIPVEESITSSASPVYEPISPASTFDSNEDDSSSCWEPSQPNESLQRLFDLQTMLSL